MGATYGRQVQRMPPDAGSAHVEDRGFTGCYEERTQTPLRHWITAQMNFDLALVGQGFMHQNNSMMVMDEVQHGSRERSSGTGTRLKVDFGRRKFVISVNRYLHRLPSNAADDSSNARAKTRRVPVQYRIDIDFNWIKNIREQRFPGGLVCIVVALDSPPLYWRRLPKVAKTHGEGRLARSDKEQWVRLTSLNADQRVPRDSAASLRGVFPQGQAVDIGRWTTFRLGLHQNDSGRWQDAAAYLRDYNIQVISCPEFRFLHRDDRSMWACINDSAPASTPSVGNVHHLSRRLSFEVAYQLEVCISCGILQESTLDVVFLESLAALTTDRATRILEYITERGKRIYQPHTIFRDPRAASYWRKTPADAQLDKDQAVCVRKAIVTPTTIRFFTPALEAGNRVLRHFREHHDRFLRVQFTDELLFGGLYGGPSTRRVDDCFSRVFRTLKNGIQVGGRHYEFLAFGNSQLRENATYFFAPTDLISCDDIRAWMGDFSRIKSVAKYAARLGQCLSTTQMVPTFGVPTTVHRIHDVERGRFCFTDGVGKISKWWARVIATHLHLRDIPSAVQFRMGGCKGVLAVWPDVPSGQVVQIRPSQEKFPTADRANTLEIVRCSETATATLNQQTIILLSSLGVPDCVFMDLLSEELAGLNAVMNDARKAVARLMVRVDQNQITPMIADMVKAGFMSSGEPFVWALLQLWRSWTLKALKDKARITVEKSAFVLGCVDETDTLRGHKVKYKEAGVDHVLEDEMEDKASHLPEIFLQVPDLEYAEDRYGISAHGFNRISTNGRKYKVVTGFCLVGRNPSLHPGDLRVVEAVDVPALHHLRDVVVFPRTGDRDIPGMCSGGDLDGDDYFVFWDERLLPPRESWNYEAMDYDAVGEKDVEHITPRHLISFFVEHMKFDTLPRIAMSHRAYADQLEDGAMNPRCLELAQLHSQAVDYAKTGVPALLPHRLVPKETPHWMGRPSKRKSSRRQYVSNTVLGHIYDSVQVENFAPAYDKPFDERILCYYPNLDIELLRRARRIKTQYDLALRRAMAQKEIENEFEVWSGFSLTRPRVGTDYKVAEDIGRLFRVIMTRFRSLCLREVDDSRDISKLGPFVASMYQVTYEEVRITMHEFAQSQLHTYPADSRDTESKEFSTRLDKHSHPFISFPWLFPQELAAIARATDALRQADAKQGKGHSPEAEISSSTSSEDIFAHQNTLLSSDDLEKMEYSIQNGVPTHHGVPLAISVYNGAEEGGDDQMQDEDNFEPVWTLPPGKSEADIIIEPITPVAGPDGDTGHSGDGGDGYHFLDLGIDSGSIANKLGDCHPGRNKSIKSFPLEDFKGVVFSATDEEKFGRSQGKVDPETQSDKLSNGVEHVKKLLPFGLEDEKLPEELKKSFPSMNVLPARESGINSRFGGKGDGLRDDEVVAAARQEHDAETTDDDDIFVAVDSLFGEKRGRPKTADVNPA